MEPTGLNPCLRQARLPAMRAAGLIRCCDVALSVLGLAVGLPGLLGLLVLGWLDTGSPLFRQERVGRHGRPFTLVKFCTMRPGTASVATHLATASAITPLSAADQAR